MNRIASAGLRLTPQRLAIAAFLEGNTGHPSALEILHAVRRRYPTLSFATVYNTLEAIKRVDGLRELTIDSSRRRYDPDTGSHHHLICRRCSRIVDIRAGYRLELPARVAREFEVSGNHVEFFGTCRQCRQRAPRPPRRPAPQPKRRRTT